MDDFAVLARFTELADSAGRLPYHLAGRDAFLAQPLVGSSSEGLLQHLQQYRFTTNTSAHLVYLTWLAKYGLVGWSIYTAFLVAPLVLVGLDRRYDPRWRHLVVGSYLPLLFMYLAYDYFLTVEIQYIIFGIGYALALRRPGAVWPADPQATT